MATVQISGLPELLAAVGDDWLEIEEAATGLSYRIKKANLIGAILTGGGTIATGGHTITVPASGTAALKTGTPTEGNLAAWADANTVQDAGVALSAMALLGTEQTWTATQTFSAIRTGDTGPILDDNVVVLSAAPNPCMILFFPTSGATPSVIAMFRPAAPASQLVATNNDTQVSVTTGVLTGTTGTDGLVNLSCSGGNVYVENRRGFGIQYRYLILG